MAKRKRIRRDWPAVVQAQEVSGLSVSAFCHKRGISASLFYHWRQRCQAPALPAAGDAFVELHPVDRPAPGQGLVLVTADGWRLELEPGFDAPTLQRALVCLSSGAACSP